MKPSEVLIKAAKLVEKAGHDKNHKYMLYGCHAIIGVVMRKTLKTIYGPPLLSTYLNDPQVIAAKKYYLLLTPQEYAVPIWRDPETYEEMTNDHRIIALLMAAQIAQSEGN